MWDTDLQDFVVEPFRRGELTSGQARVMIDQWKREIRGVHRSRVLHLAKVAEIECGLREARKTGKER